MNRVNIRMYGATLKIIESIFILPYRMPCLSFLSYTGWDTVRLSDALATESFYIGVDN